MTAHPRTAADETAEERTEDYWANHPDEREPRPSVMLGRCLFVSFVLALLYLLALAATGGRWGFAALVLVAFMVATVCGVGVGALLVRWWHGGRL